MNYTEENAVNVYMALVIIDNLLWGKYLWLRGVYEAMEGDYRCGKPALPSLNGDIGNVSRAIRDHGYLRAIAPELFREICKIAGD